MASPPGLGSNGPRAAGSSSGLTGLLAHLSEPVASWDQDLRLRAANAAFAELFGVPAGSLEGCRLDELLGPDTYAASRSAIESALGGHEQPVEWTRTDGDGRTRTLCTSYLPDGTGLLSVTTDPGAAAASELLQENIDQYRALARSMPSGFVLLFDRDLRVVIADGVELPTFGYSRESLEGRTVWEGFAPELAVELEPRYRRALLGESVSWERQLGNRTFKLTAGPVRPDSGDIVAGMVTALDISTERRAERSWAALHAIATSVVRKTDPGAVAWSIASELVALFEVDRASVVRFTPAGQAQVLAMAPEPLATLDSLITFGPDDDSAVAKVLRTGQPSLTTYTPDAGPIARALAASGATAGAAAPIRGQDGLWGAVALVAREGSVLDQTVLDHLASFAELVALAVGNSEEWGTLERAASTDELTGLPNRRVFLTHLQAEYDRSRRHQRPMSVVVMDLDHFKNVNDTWGHPVGDRVLAEFGRRLSENSRGSELVARLGGEEFGWILPETEASVAVVAAERLRGVVSHEPFDTVGRLTVSVGIASIVDVVDLDGLMAGADEALYAAKHAGRDRVSVYVPTTGVPASWGSA